MTTERKIWVGCLGCYNNGRLVGEWMDPADYDPDDPTASIPRLVKHDQLGILCSQCGSDDANRWVFDHEGYGIALRGECNADEAHRLDALMTAIEDDVPDDVPVTVILEWFADGGEIPTEWDAPTEEAFKDAYRGKFDSDRDYAYHVVETFGWAGLEVVPDSVSMYFDWDLIARDLRAEMTVIEHQGDRYYFVDT